MTSSWGCGERIVVRNFGTKLDCRYPRQIRKDEKVVGRLYGFGCGFEMLRVPRFARLITLDHRALKAFPLMSRRASS
jgi:hypothetical protein